MELFWMSISLNFFLLKMSASRVSLKRALLISEIGKGVRWHENLPGGFQIQEGLLQTSVGIPWRIGNSTSTLQTFGTVDEKESWIPWVGGGGQKAPLLIWLIDGSLLQLADLAFSNTIWLFMCCPAFTAGQMELRKMRVTVLFLLQSVCFPD